MTFKGIPVVPGLRLLGQGQAPDHTYVVALRIKVLGKWSTLSIPLEQTTTPLLIELALARAGFGSRGRKKAAKELTTCLNTSNTIPVVTIANGNGWYDDHSAFVFGRKVLGEPKQPTIVLSAGHTAQAEGILEVGTARGGSWKAWREGTRSALRHSDYLLSAVCFGLAGPMASHFREIESGLIHFHGESSTGKTVLLSTAWSLFGACSRELLPNWNTTPTGFEEQLDICTDLPFVCDELTFQKDAPDASHNLKAACYAISSNRKKSRSKRWSGRGSAAVRRGKTFVLSNGEDSLSATRDTESRRLGEQCRAMDVAVQPREGIFRRLPSGIEFSEFVHDLQLCCEENYGHPGRKFIKFLIEQGHAWPQRATMAMKKFYQLAKVPDTRLDRRFACRFAIAYAAGLEARRCGVLDLSAKQIGRSLRRVYSVSSRPSTDQSAKANDVLSVLRGRLDDEAGLKVWSPESTHIDAADGDILLRKDSRDEVVFMVPSAYLLSLCGSKEVWRTTLALLRRGNYLLDGPGGVATRQITVDGARRRFLCVKGNLASDELSCGPQVEHGYSK